MPDRLAVIDAEALPEPPPWSDWPGFLAWVYRECRRLKAPQPTVDQLRGEYRQRRVAQHGATVAEVRLELAGWEQARRRGAR